MFHVFWLKFDGSRDSFTRATAKETFDEIVSRGLWSGAPGLRIKDAEGGRLSLKDLQNLVVAQAAAEQPQDWKDWKDWKG